jgi:uncharacterized protein
MAEATYRTPGVYIQQVKLTPGVELRTGVPILIGYAGDGEERPVQEIAQWADFQRSFGAGMPADCYLAYAVRGFFSNGGRLCYVKAIDRSAAIDIVLRQTLETLSQNRFMEAIDLVCVPDLMLFPSKATALQQVVLDFCRCGANGNSGRCFAVLDALPGLDIEGVLEQRQHLAGENGAIYYPWIRIQDGPASITTAASGFVPPCGHIAGIYARSDRTTGVHKAPANEIIEEAIDLGKILTDADQGRLNPLRVNCLRSFPGRGIRVWGARTLSNDSAWLYVSVRRVLLTICRWLEQKMTGFAFEPHQPLLWLRITREIQAYLGDLYLKGVFTGKTMEEAFYVKCDEEINPPEVRDLGQIVAEIGIAVAAPGEFIVIRIIQSDGGIVISQSSSVDAGGDGGSGNVTPLPIPQPAVKPVVNITHIEADVPGPDVLGEYVLIRNDGDTSVDLANWLLCDASGHRFVFPRHTLTPQATVKVWTKIGTDTATDLYWNSKSAIWNNAGDRALLYDSQNNLIAELNYTGTK